MITRLQINGFKNLVETDIRFGPVTCIAGENGVGKSNLFDAIQFLSMTATLPLMEAAASVRGNPRNRPAPSAIFRKFGANRMNEMSFDVEMVVPKEATDDLGQLAEATSTFLRYSLSLRLEGSVIRIRREELTYIPLGKAPRNLRFKNSSAWQRSVLKSGRFGAPFISTKGETILLHQDQAGSGKSRAGRPRPHDAVRLPRTVLSTANAAESKTVVAAKREMEAWQLLQLEPSALREPDSYSAHRQLRRDGAHMPATLSRLVEWKRESTAPLFESDVSDVCSRVGNTLSKLIDGVRSISLDADDRRELLTIMLTDTAGSEFEARSLSDGTLRFLALAILEEDPEATGVWCLEEPENGIHPARIPAMVRLLSDVAVDTTLPVDQTNPLRQVIFNTHSPRVVGFCDHEDVLLIVPQLATEDGISSVVPTFRWLANTWRHKDRPDIATVAPGSIVEYLRLGRSDPSADDDVLRVIDRDDLQQWLPGFSNPDAP